MPAGVDTSADEPDPSTYSDTFPADGPGIFVVYLLDADANVDITWSRGARWVSRTGELQYSQMSSQGIVPVSTKKSIRRQVA